jgi:hypothetical protein
MSASPWGGSSMSASAKTTVSPEARNAPTFRAAPAPRRGIATTAGRSGCRLADSAVPSSDPSSTTMTSGASAVSWAASASKTVGRL